MSNKEMWKFSKINAIEESIFNNTLERFYKFGIEGLVRENIQNSIDAKLPGNEEAVVVNIQLGKIQKENIPEIGHLEKRINQLKGHNSYSRGTIAYMQEKIKQEEVEFISFEDCNTKGLTGAKNGQSNCKDDTWGIYAYNKGVHFEESNKELEDVRGGSHGIGKIASNSASDIHLIFFANCDKVGQKHLGGTIQLIEHEFENSFYRSTGYFTDLNIEENKFYPYENKFDSIFSKDTRGLKIIIPFLRKEFNDEKEVIKSVCSNFFLAIIKGKLIVKVNEKLIDKEHIKTYIYDNEYYKQNKCEIKEDFTPLYLETYNKIKPRILEISSKDSIYKFKLYFNYDKEIVRARVAIIRTVGMKIEDKKIKGNILRPFNAIMIPATNKEDIFLKSLENESHTAISYDHIKDNKLKNNAKRFINNLDKEIQKILEEEMRKANPTDGMLDTKDTIYTVESKFKSEIAKNMKTIIINNGNKNSKKLIKTSSDIDTGIAGNTDGDLIKAVRDEKKSKAEKSNVLGKSRKARKLKVGNDVNRERGKDTEGKYLERYKTSSDIVDRIVMEKKEIIKIDFTETEDLSKNRFCNITFAVIDGMGNEYNNEFNVKDSYEKVIDKSVNKECILSENTIKNVQIMDGIVKMELYINKSFNRALKFMYYVEV